jgi:choline dehydrogenase-like flavoprotein
MSVDARTEPRRRRELRLPAPEIHELRTADGVDLRLTRYAGGDKGPVVCAPGFGTSTLAFSIDTTETNFVEFACDRSYDVWLFDYRASPLLASAQTQFTLDEVATQDWPTAIAKVREVSGAADVQVAAHCVGSMSFLMAELAGLEGVRSAVCSCLGLYPKTETLNWIRAQAHLATIAEKVGLKRMSTDYHPEQLDDRVVDKLLHLYPTHERCDNPVCRRILFLYGDVYDHDRLNEATHRSIHELFGTANATALRHVTAMVRKGRVVDSNGEDAYLPRIEQLKLPLAFIHGEHNHLFVPEGTSRTFDLLRESNGESLYRRHVISDYAHMDCWIGEHAARDVFPIVVAELDEHN